MSYKKGIIHYHGQVNKAIDLNGRVVERAEWYFVILGNEFKAVRAVPDQDHFIYQNLMPVTDKDLIKYGGVIPQHLRGPHLMCTCGAEAQVIVGGEYDGMAICGFYGRFGIHQTSAKIVDGQIILPKRIESQYTHDDPEEIITKDLKVARKYG